MELGTGVGQLNPRKNFRLPEELIDGYELYIKLRQEEKRGERKVSLIGRPLANGNVALYRYAWVDGEKKQEATGATLHPELRAEDKNANIRILRKERERCAQLAVELRDGNTTFQPALKRDTRKLLSEYIDEQRETFKPSFRDLLHALARHITIYNANLRVVQMKEDVLSDFLCYLRERATALSSKKGKPLSSNTQATFAQLLQCVLNNAVRDKIIRSNPFFSLPKGERPQKEYERRTYLTPQEVAKLMRTPYRPAEKRNVKEDTPKAFFFSCFTGLRFSDVVGLKGGNVKEDEAGTYIEFEVKKTKKVQTLYLNDLALKYLPKQRSKNKPLFDLPNNSQVNKDIRQWAADAGIGKEVTFHVARHTCATMELNAGVPLAEVANQLGHADVRVTQVYAKVMRNTQQKATNRMANFFKLETE